MKRYMPKLLAFILMAASVSVFAQATTDSDKAAKWKKMDVNKDGMISKDEFMKYQEGQWNAWKKNNEGLLDIKTMQQQQPKKSMEWDGKSTSK